MLVAAVVGLGWLTLGSGSRVAATDDEGAPNAEPNVETDAIIYWEKNDIPADLPETEELDESNLNLEPAPAVPATPKTGQGNEEWDEWYGSGRVFPGLRYYGETNDSEGVPYADRRRRVLAVVKWVKGNAPDEVHFRLWDVDDPSDDDGPIDSDTHGPDNKDATGGHFPGEDGNHIVSVHKGKVLRFKKGGGIEETEGQANCYKVETVVGMRPGDNYRFAASANKQELIAMTQAMADKAERPATGRISKILTVWRKLHLELDSMAFTWDNNVVGRNLDDTYGPNVPHPGDSGAEINGWHCPDNGRYEGGYLYLYGGPDFEIIDNEDDIGDDTVYVKDREQPPVGDITPYEDWTAGFCDDDVLIQSRTVDWSLVNEKFAPAYIEAEEDVEAQDLDVPFIPTVRNAPGPLFEAADPRKDRATSRDYWVALLLSAHQGKLLDETPFEGIQSEVDGDPDMFYHFHGGVPSKLGDPGLLWGSSCYAIDYAGGQRAPNVALLFLEALREHGAWSAAGWIIPSSSAQTAEKITVVHELGHVFGWLQEGPPGTLMERSNVNPAVMFNEDQIKFLRESDEIEQEDPW
jgi:hypothetical protein